jgi:hypothetical protein
VTAAILSVFIVGCLIGATIAQSGAITITPESFSGDYSYIIESDGTYVWAKDGMTGQVVFGGANNVGGISGTDASAVIQSAINALTNGGKIFTKKSVNVTWHAGTGADRPFIYINSSNIEIEGEPGHQITVLGQGTAIKACGTSDNPIKNVIIKNLNFVGDPTNDENHGISFSYVNNGLIEGCTLTDFGDEEISVGLGSRNVIIRNNWLVSSNNTHVGAPITIQSSKHSVESNFITLNAPTVGIHLEAIAGTEQISDVTITDNTIYCQNIGAFGIALTRIAFNITDVIIKGNKVYDATYDGISDSNLAGGTMKAINILVANNIIEGGGTNNNARGAIRFDKNNPEKISIVGNIIKDYGLTNPYANGICINSYGAIVADNRISGVGCSGLKLSADNIVAIGNFIENSQQSHNLGAILSEGSYQCIIGNHLGDGYRGIRTYGTATGSIIIGNRFGTHAIPFDKASGGTFMFEDNINYVTKNSGTATIPTSQTSVTVNHGLAGTPTVITVTPRGNIGAVWVSARNSTSFTITCGTAPSSDTIADWYAEYKP